MSVETMVAGGIIGQAGQSQLLNAIQELTEEVKLLRAFRDQPFIFMKSESDSSVNQAVGTIIIPGIKVTPGHRGTVLAANITFTAAGGTVQIVILDPSGAIRQTLQQGLTANSNGIDATVLDENESIALAVEVQGVATIRAIFTGTIQRFRI